MAYSTNKPTATFDPSSNDALTTTIARGASLGSAFIGLTFGAMFCISCLRRRRRVHAAPASINNPEANVANNAAADDPDELRINISRANPNNPISNPLPGIPPLRLNELPTADTTINSAHVATSHPATNFNLFRYLKDDNTLDIRVDEATGLTFVRVVGTDLYEPFEALTTSNNSTAVGSNNSMAPQLQAMPGHSQLTGSDAATLGSAAGNATSFRVIRNSSDEERPSTSSSPAGSQ